MKYLKTFDSYDYRDTNPLTAYGKTMGTDGNTIKKVKLSGELVDDEDDDILIPSDIEITGHIGDPVVKVRLQKNSKEPKVKNC